MIISRLSLAGLITLALCLSIAFEGRSLLEKTCQMDALLPCVRNPSWPHLNWDFLQVCTHEQGVCAEPRPEPTGPQPGSSSSTEPAPPVPAGVPASGQRGAVWVNEFHYNNTGKDEGEVRLLGTHIQSSGCADSIRLRQNSGRSMVSKYLFPALPVN